MAGKGRRKHSAICCKRMGINILIRLSWLCLEASRPSGQATDELSPQTLEVALPGSTGAWRASHSWSPPPSHTPESPRLFQEARGRIGGPGPSLLTRFQCLLAATPDHSPGPFPIFPVFPSVWSLAPAFCLHSLGSSGGSSWGVGCFSAVPQSSVPPFS